MSIQDLLEPNSYKLNAGSLSYLGTYGSIGASGPTGSSSNSESVAQVLLTSAQVLALFSTPVQIVPAPGAGKYIVARSMDLDLQYNSVAYVGANPISLVVGGVVEVQATNASFLSSTASTVLTQYPALASELGANGTALATVVNQPLNIQVSNANPTTGNSPLLVTVKYSVLSAV